MRRREREEPGLVLIVLPRCGLRNAVNLKRAGVPPDLEHVRRYEAQQKAKKMSRRCPKKGSRRRRTKGEGSKKAGAHDQERRRGVRKERRA